MPMFDFECKSCGKVVNDKLVKMGVTEVECVDCGSTMQKKVSRTSFELKGKGWYKDGYK